MNSVRWDRETGGVLLASAFSTGAVDVITGAARPVFWEELDLLGLSKVWKYPHVSEPLLWAVDRRYYYRGDPVLDVHGGGMTTEPKLTFINTSRLRLRPVDVAAMLDRNSAVLETLENEAMEFVLRTYRRFRKRVDFTVVAFSGGKDSQVILECESALTLISTWSSSPTYQGMPCTSRRLNMRKQYGERFPCTQVPHSTPRDASTRACPVWAPSRMHSGAACLQVCPVVRLLQRSGDGRSESLSLMGAGR